jgi:hypothetical protein
MRFMGMNAILIFFWHGTAEVTDFGRLLFLFICDNTNNLYLYLFLLAILQSVLDVVYFQQPKVGGGFVDEQRGYLFGERVGWFNSEILGWLSPEFAQFVYVLLKISCYSVAMWYCQKVGYFWKV